MTNETVDKNLRGQYEILYNEIQTLPDEIKNKKTRLLLPVGKFKDEKIFYNLPADLILVDFPKWLAENNLPFDEKEFLEFVDELQVDLKSYTKKLIHASFNKMHEFEVICRRVQNETLKEIGKNLGLTRERVRQIESNWLKNFLIKEFELKKVFYLLRAVADKEFVLTLDDIKSFIDPFDAEIIWFAAQKADFFIFDKEIDSIVFHKVEDFDAAEILKNLPEIMEEKVFNETLEKIAREKNLPLDLLKVKILKSYKQEGKFLYRKMLTLAFKLAYILKVGFPNGYKIADKASYWRFIGYMKEIFDDKTLYSQRNIDGTLGKVAVLCNRGRYIHPDFVHVPPEIVEQVRNFIETSDQTKIFYKDIFQSLKKIFVGTQITNHYFLQGVIKLNKFQYTFRRDYLSKSKEINIKEESD